MSIRVIGPAPIWDDLALFASIWHFARFAFQIKVIRWISRNNAEEENGCIPIFRMDTNLFNQFHLQKFCIKVYC